MNKLSLYWKTWVLTVCTLLITSALLFFALSYSMSWLVESTQVHKFYQSIVNIEKELLMFGVRDDILEKYLRQGFSITITNENTILFPENEAFLEDPETFESYKTPIDAPNGTPEQSNDDMLKFGDILSIDKQISLDEGSLLLSANFPLSFSSSDVRAIFSKILPYFTVLGISIASVAAFVYARFFSGKISRLNTIINRMSSQSYPTHAPTQSKGDELQSLENNLNLMYQELTETLTSLNEEVSRVNRLEDDRRLFMRGAVHELKTPIMSMSTYILMNMESYTDDSKQLDFLNLYHSKLQGMSLLVNEILEVSKLESIRKVGKSQLDPIIKACLDVFEYMIHDKNLNIVYSKTSDISLEIPQRNLMKIISNLCGNAIKYACDKSSITLEIGKSAFTISNTINDDHRIDLNKIMDPFVSFENAEDSFKGHGLGLYIVGSILDHYQYPYDISINNAHFTFTIMFKEELESNTI